MSCNVNGGFGIWAHNLLEMVRRRAKRNVKKPSQNRESDSNFTNAEEQEIDKQRYQFIDNEVERRITASKAIRDAETEHLLTGLRLLRSIYKEHLQIPVIHFFKENIPNMTMKINEKDGQFEVEWKNNDGDVSVSHADETNMHESLLQQISKACPDFGAAGMPSVTGFEFSSKAVNATDLLSAVDFQFPDIVLEEPSESQNFGLQNAFHTPGANSQRLSVGMTPKTLRLPKPGEMLLSVRGSPLGVYKDDNMEAIHESEEI